MFIDLLKIKESFVESTKIDRIRMFAAMQPFIENLLSNGIYKLQNIVQILKENGLDSNSMVNFMGNLEKSFKIKKIINKRERKKTNQTEKNIFFNSLCLDYPDQMLLAIVDYLVRFANVRNRKSLHDLIKEKIDKILIQAKNFFNSNINTNFNNNNNQILHNNIIDQDNNDTDMFHENILDEPFEMNKTDLFIENPKEPIISENNEKFLEGAKVELIEKSQVLKVIKYNDDDYFLDDECQSTTLYY